MNKEGRPPVDPVKRFWPRVKKTDTCWLWTGGKIPDGYGQFWSGTRRVGAHRFAYELLVGPIPDGLTLDHLCRVRHCVNPDHLEPVTAVENVKRSPIALSAVNAAKTHCIQGHEFTPENTYRRPDGYRECIPCNREAKRRYEARKAAHV